jgi:hypothetical protein
MTTPPVSLVRRAVPALALALLLAGCAAPVLKVESGSAMVKERLLVDVAVPWNQFQHGPYAETPTWTHEGVTVDALQFYVGVKDGQLIAPTPREPKGARALAFKSTMQTADIVELFQTLWSRDGSQVSIERIEPAPFMGGDGFKVEYAVVRKRDDVRLQGVAWGAVRGGELFVINYSAPRLAFFARYRPQVEAIARSARLRS